MLHWSQRPVRTRKTKARSTAAWKCFCWSRAEGIGRWRRRPGTRRRAARRYQTNYWPTADPQLRAYKRGGQKSTVAASAMADSLARVRLDQAGRPPTSWNCTPKTSRLIGASRKGLGLSEVEGRGFERGFRVNRNPRILRSSGSAQHVVRNTPGSRAAGPALM